MIRDGDSGGGMVVGGVVGVVGVVVVVEIDGRFWS